MKDFFRGYNSNHTTSTLLRKAKMMERYKIRLILKTDFVIITDKTIPCPHCHTLRRYMKKLGHEFVEMDVSEYKKVGGTIKGQPTLFYNGSDVFHGLPGSIRQFKEMIEEIMG